MAISARPPSPPRGGWCSTASPSPSPAPRKRRSTSSPRTSRSRAARQQATAIGNGYRLNTVSAAALNGAAMHVLDFEPMWSPANHALSTTLAGVLALAEARGSSGREVLTALVKGVEMQGWIRQASGQFEARKIRFHPPGAAGPARCRGRGRTPAGARCRPARQRHRHLRLQGRQPARQRRHHDEVHPLRPCRGAGPGVGAARRARLHRQRRGVRGRARLRAGLLRHRLQGRGDAGLRPCAVPHRRSGLCDQDVSEPVRHPFRHHRRARAAPARFPLPPPSAAWS